jgi:hypothetical protein
MTEFYERAKRYLAGRAASYHRVFVQEGIDATIVLADLAKFCRAHDSTGHPDAHVAARLDGRREVWLRIQHHLKLSNDELWGLYGNKHITKE